MHKKFQEYRFKVQSQPGVAFLIGPPYSPDLNPIEKVQGFLKKKLARDSPQTPKELTACLHRWWCDLENTYAEKLNYSMFKRCDNVIKHSGLRD